jgi:hypothetical protein
MQEQITAKQEHILESRIGGKNANRYNKGKRNTAGAHKRQIHDPSREMVVLLTDAIHGKGNAHGRGDSDEHVRQNREHTERLIPNLFYKLGR